MSELHDARLLPQIPTLNVWLSVFGMYVLRLRSFNALEQELRVGKRWEAWVGSRKPSADTIGRVVAKMSPDELRQVLVSIHRSAWRRKAIHTRPAESYRVVAVDGHEVGASRARCCPECLVREITLGEKTVLEYYHRVVVAQWVGVTPPAILDLERIKPNEGEVVAARRLLERVLLQHARLIDVISADALYLEAPFFKLVLDAGKHAVVVIKQERRDLYRDAERLRNLIEPQILVDGPRTTRLWDIPDLTSFTTLDRPVRVVWAEEETLKHKVVGGNTEDVLEKRTWIWVTDLPAATIPAAKIQLWGHDRWHLENRGFNELSSLWHMDHYFIHDATAIETLLLTLAIAFVTTYLFYERNLKAPVRRHLTRLAMAA
ncbi:MAG TPA: transposase, partial [Candidatus Methylomirabilis sp.]|nr:transposase [Candidatus Methylomirabilis sp.]